MGFEISSIAKDAALRMPETCSPPYQRIEQKSTWSPLTLIHHQGTIWLPSTNGHSSQSPDGTNRYEDISALLRLKDGAWEVLEIPCGDVENPECLSGQELFKKLQKRYPGVPVEIFPNWS
jgi:hypothetical protein